MMHDIPKEVLLKMYRDMLTGRKLDEAFLTLGGTPGFEMDTPHRGAGEEAVVVGICANLRQDDYIKVTTRTRHCLVAKGLSIPDVVGTKAFKDLRPSGGHCSYYSREFGVIPYSGTLGEDVMVATGAALAEKLKKTDRVTVAIYGDGAGNRPSIHTSMVFAAAFKLPIVFVVQNNQYGMGTSVKKSYAITDLSERARAYGFPGVSVDGNDVVAIYDVAKEYVERARKGGGPGLIDAETYRLYGHYEGEPQKYRPAGEAEEWQKLDPIPRYRKRLVEAGIVTEADADALDRQVKAEVDAGIDACRTMPLWKIEDYLKCCIAEL